MYTILLIVVIAFFVYLWNCGGKKNTPPGPRGPPILGIGGQLDFSTAHLTLTKWALKYGPMYYCSALGINILVLNDADLIRKAFTDEKYQHIFNDRTPTFIGKYILWNYKEIAFGFYNESLTKMRKVLHKSLHFYGSGVSSFEALVDSQLDQLMTDLRKENGKEMCPREAIEDSFCRITSSLLTGKPPKPGRDDAVLIWNYLRTLNPLMNVAFDATMQALPFLRLVPGYFRNTYLALLKRRDEILERFYETPKGRNVCASMTYRWSLVDGLSNQARFILKTMPDKFLQTFKNTIEMIGLIRTSFSHDRLVVTSHWYSIWIFFGSLLHNYPSSYEPGKENCLVHHFITLQRQTGLEEDHCRGIVLDTIGGAILTSTTSILGILLLLLNHPESYKRIQMELDEVIGKNRRPNLEDRKYLPYTNAVLIESLRYISHVLIIPHRSMDETEFEGYTIPKGTQIMANHWAVHHDEAFWGDPWVFRPERFLTEDGDLVNANHPLRQALFTFSVGKRNCIGEALARSRLFLYLSNIAQQFDLTPGVTPLPSPDPRGYLTGGLVLEPPIFKCKFLSRT